MASWREIEQDAPEFAARVRSLFDAGTNKVLATLRSDGAPRVSGSEAVFQDGEFTFGMMPGSVKLADVRRDPRVAFHCPSSEPPKDRPQDWPGDAKLSGRAVETSEGSFRLDITEAVLTYVDDPPEQLVIESWHEGRGYRRRRRK